MSQATVDATLRITQVRSLIGVKPDQRRTVRALGLRRIRHTVTQPDRPEIRGMVAKVATLIEVRYDGEDTILGLQPGQHPKGPGRPPAAAEVADSEVTGLREAEAEAVAEGGQVDNLSDLVQAPGGLSSVDAPDAPNAPSGPASAEGLVAEDTPPSDEALADPRGDMDRDADAAETAGGADAEAGVPSAPGSQPVGPADDVANPAEDADVDQPGPAHATTDPEALADEEPS